MIFSSASAGFGGGGCREGWDVVVVTAVLDVIFTGVHVVIADTFGGGGGGRAVGLIVLHTLGGCDVINHDGEGRPVVVFEVTGKEFEFQSSVTLKRKMIEKKFSNKSWSL